MCKVRCVFLCSLLVGAAGPLLAAPIVGSVVTGSLFFNNDTTFNGFSVANGGSGTTATIGSGGEFTYTDAYNTDTANFSANGLRITDIVSVNAGRFTMTFTDPSFTGFALASGSPGFGYAFTGDTLTVNFAGTTVPSTYTAVFDYTAASATPEPGSIVLLATGMLGVLGCTSNLRGRSRNQSSTSSTNLMESAGGT